MRFRDNTKPDWTHDRHFNMDAAVLDRINDKLSLTNDAGIENDQYKRFRGLKIVFNNFCFKIKTQKDIDDIDAQIKKINGIFANKAVKNTDRVNLMQHRAIRHNNAEELLDTLERDINKLLYKYDIINLKIKKKKGYEKRETWG
jgi:hypothetical protein